MGDSDEDVRKIGVVGISLGTFLGFAFERVGCDRAVRFSHSTGGGGFGEDLIRKGNCVEIFHFHEVAQRIVKGHITGLGGVGPRLNVSRRGQALGRAGDDVLENLIQLVRVGSSFVVIGIFAAVVGILGALAHIVIGGGVGVVAGDRVHEMVCMGRFVIPYRPYRRNRGVSRRVSTAENTNGINFSFVIFQRFCFGYGIICYRWHKAVRIVGRTVCKENDDLFGTITGNVECFLRFF